MRGLAKIKKSKDYLERVVPLEHELIRSSNAGHMLGSNMFMLNAGQKVLYTGDYCPQDRLGMEGARPQKCDVLIIEATYGNPYYRFPDRREMVKVIHDWVEDMLKQRCSVILHAYPLGKSQELIKMLKDFEPRLHGPVLQATQILESEGLQFDYLPFDAKHTGSQLIITNGGRGDSFRNLKNIKSAQVSGWCLDNNRRSIGKLSWGFDQGFPYSDHADFYETMDFIKKCDPSLVYTNHGYEDMLAHEIQKRLGITAIPLSKEKKGQTNLGCYC